MYPIIIISTVALISFPHSSSLLPDDKVSGVPSHHKRASLDSYSLSRPFDFDYTAGFDAFPRFDDSTLFSEQNPPYRPQRSASEIDEDLLPSSFDYTMASGRAGEERHRSLLENFNCESLRSTRHNSVSSIPPPTNPTLSQDTSLLGDGVAQPPLSSAPLYSNVVKGTVSLRPYPPAESGFVRDSLLSLSSSQSLSSSPSFPSISSHLPPQDRLASLGGCSRWN